MPLHRLSPASLTYLIALVVDYYKAQNLQRTWRMLL